MPFQEYCWKKQTIKAPPKLKTNPLGQESSWLDTWHIFLMIFLPKVLKFCWELPGFSYFPKHFLLRILESWEVDFPLEVFVFFSFFKACRLTLASFNYHLFVNSWKRIYLSTADGLSDPDFVRWKGWQQMCDLQHRLQLLAQKQASGYSQSQKMLKLE